MYVCMHVCMYACNVCMYVCACMYACMYVCSACAYICDIFYICHVCMHFCDGMVCTHVSYMYVFIYLFAYSRLDYFNDHFWLIDLHFWSKGTLIAIHLCLFGIRSIGILFLFFLFAWFSWYLNQYHFQLFHLSLQFLLVNWNLIHPLFPSLALFSSLNSL